MEFQSSDVIFCITKFLSYYDIVRLSHTCSRLRSKLKSQVKFIEVHIKHLSWMKKFKRRNKSMLQAWCYKLDNNYDRVAQNMLEYRKLHYFLSMVRVKPTECRMCEETIPWCQHRVCLQCSECLQEKEIDCFVSWNFNDHCLRCTRVLEYEFIQGGSADESETEHMFSFQKAAH